MGLFDDLKNAFASVGTAASSGLQRAKTAVTGTPATVSDGYPAQGARRKKTKKAGRRKKRTMRWF